MIFLQINIRTKQVLENNNKVNTEAILANCLSSFILCSYGFIEVTNESDENVNSFHFLIIGNNRLAMTTSSQI